MLNTWGRSPVSEPQILRPENGGATMKKYLAILLAIVMACTILAACGGNASSTTQPASSEGAVSRESLI